MTDMPEDAAGGFAALMNKAQEAADAEQAEAPYGYTTDPDTGEERPKRAAGRPRKPPAVDELKAERAAAEPPPAADRAPEEKRTRLRSSKGSAGKPEAPEVQYRAGMIAKGMNKLYARTGKLIRVGDPEIGQAFIDATRKESDDDVTVGEAWEELAKTNPRVRKFLMKLIAGGAVGQLLMAHAPIALAVVMKPAVLRHIPFARLVESMAEPDEDTPEGEGGLPGGMTEADAQQMAQLAQAQMAKMGMAISPEVAAGMAQMAANMANGSAPPVKTVRNQPRRAPARAERHGG